METGLDGLPQNKKSELEFKIEENEERSNQERLRFDSELEKKFIKLRLEDESFMEDAYSIFISGDEKEIQELKESTVDEKHDFVEWLDEILKKRFELDQIQDILDEKYKEFIEENLETNILDIFSRLDLDKAVGEYVKDSNLNELNRDLNLVNDIRVRVVENTIGDMSLDSISSLDDLVNKFKDNLNSRSLLTGNLSLSENNFDSFDPDTEMSDRDNLKDKINKLKNELNQFAIKATDYRSFSDINKTNKAILKIDDINDFLSQENVNIKSDIFKSIKKYTETLHDEMAMLDLLPLTERHKYMYQKQLNNIDKQKVMKELSVKGINVLEGHLSDKDLHFYIGRLIPASILTNIKQIEIIKGTDLLSKLKEKKDKDELASGTIFERTNLDGEAELFIESYTSTKNEDKRQVDDAVDTSFHEIGHAAHKKLLSPDDLHNWEKVVKDEAVGFSRSIPEKNKSNYPVELFAETFKFVFLYPNTLKEFSPKNFEFMFNFILSKSSDEEKEIIRQHINRKLVDN